MVDIHTHILPSVDDGAPDWNVALEMAAQAVRSGVRHLVMTPHCNIPEMFDNYNDQDQMRQKMQRFREQVQAAGIPLELYTGMEVFGTIEVPRYLEEGRLLTIHDTRYLLIEFAFVGEEKWVTEILHEIRKLDYIPIVAHPERYSYVQENPEIVDRWIRMGCGIQVNKGSILGRFGKMPYACSRFLLEQGMVSCVASDAHHSQWRTTYLDEVHAVLAERYGEDYSDFLTRRNPKRILQGKELLWPIA